MIIPKRTIPRVGVAALVLGGCGDDVVDSPASAARALCELGERCDPADFYSEYTSLSECRGTLSRLIETYVDYYRLEYSPACGDAIEDYYFCIAQEAADQNADNVCFDLSDVVCSREYERADTVCDF